MSVLLQTKYDFKNSRTMNSAQLSERASQIRGQLSSGSRVSLESADSNSPLKKAKLEAERLINKNLFAASEAVRDATVRLNSISEILTQMLNLSAQVDEKTGSVFSDRMFQLLLRSAESKAFSAKEGVFNLLAGGSGMYVNVETTSLKAKRYVMISSVNIGEMLSSGLLSDLTISSPSSARNVVAKLTSALRMINSSRSILKSNETLIERHSNESSVRIQSVSIKESALTAVERMKLSSELLSIESRLTAYRTIDQITGNNLR